MRSAEISALMAEVLGINKVAPGDNFFELGGNSINLMTLLSKIKENSDVDVSLIDVIYAPTADGIAQRMQRSDPK